MNLKILVCFALLLGGCANTATTLPARNDVPLSPPAVLSATVIECIYQQGCHPVSP